MVLGAASKTIHTKIQNQDIAICAVNSSQRGGHKFAAQGVVLPAVMNLAVLLCPANLDGII